MSLNTLIVRVAAGGTCIAGGLLFAIQSGLINGLIPAEAAAAEEERVLTSASRPSGSMTPDLPIISETAGVRLPMAAEPVAPEAMVRPTSFDPAPDAPSPAPAPANVPVSDLGLPCTVDVTATALPAAMVGLDIMAPCRTDAAVTVTHSGLRIAARTDALGLLTLDIPAFETPAFFSVAFDDGVEETVLVGLPDLDAYDRIGLVWDGDMGLELHAMEFGATFGEAGHVWHEFPASPDTAIAGEGGFLSLIDTGQSYVQTYTLPRATLREGESVRLSIDAPVTEANCTQAVMARTLRAEGAAPVDVTELSFTVPACDAVGDVLVLQNLLDDLRLASN